MKVANLIALFALAAIAMPGPAAAETRALIVGVSNYQYLDESKHLSAPKNDVKEFEDLLLKRGVKKGNMTLIADGISAENPTRKNIMDALRALTDRSKPGDFAIVYFSGHGSYQPDQPEGDPRHDEEDGYDQVFLPYDVEPTPPQLNSKEIKNAIIDDELGEFADAIRGKGVDLWFVLDSCYSGTGLRASGQFHDKKVEPADLGVRSKRLPIPRSRRRSASSPPSPAARPRRRGRYVFFSASRANEPSREIPVPGSVPAKDATWRSAFTHTLATVMTESAETDLQADHQGGERRHGRAGLPHHANGDDRGRSSGSFCLRAMTAAEQGRRSGRSCAIAARRRRCQRHRKGRDPRALRQSRMPRTPRRRATRRVIEANATEAKDFSPSRISLPARRRQYPMPRRRRRDHLARTLCAAWWSSPLDFAFDVSAPRASCRKRRKRCSARAKEVFAALRAAGAESKRSAAACILPTRTPDFVWRVTAEGFRIAPAGSDPSKLDIGAAVDLTGAEPSTKSRRRRTRILLRAYRVERLRRQAVKDAEGVSEKPRLRVAFDALPRAYDDKLGEMRRGAGNDDETRRRRARRRALHACADQRHQCRTGVALRQPLPHRSRLEFHRSLQGSAGPTRRWRPAPGARASCPTASRCPAVPISPAIRSRFSRPRSGKTWRRAISTTSRT